MNSLCPISKKCGGCSYIDMPYDEQLKLKQKNTEKLLAPMVRLEGFIGMEHPEYYRNKVTAAFTYDKKGNPVSGIYEEKTHNVISSDGCLLEDRKANEIIRSIRGLLKSFKIKVYDEDYGHGLLRHVMVRTGRNSGEIMVVLVVSSPIFPSKNNFTKALRLKHPEITTIVANVNSGSTSMVLGERNINLYGKGFITDSLCGLQFIISPNSFYQVNPIQTELIYKQAIDYAGLTGSEKVFDAYCGTGTIGLIAAANAESVTGVELNRDAVKDAVKNAKINKISNARFYAMDAGDFLERYAAEGEQVDVLFMDPPRTGSSEKFLTSVITASPKKVIYISCNPETLARDMKILIKGGYKANKAIAYDQFPMTPHVESVVLMSRIEK